MLSDDGKKSSRKWEMEKEMESVCVCEVQKYEIFGRLLNNILPHWCPVR